MRVSLAGVPIDLAPLEYRAIAYLMHNQGRVVSQAELSEHIHGTQDASLRFECDRSADCSHKAQDRG